ncbi:MAG: DUF5106 domain-containing protein [Crocinitomicaceae bacterium]|nr:DUF5106 domain-containing protein [Crocinitomicaceae bacterium]
MLNLFLQRNKASSFIVITRNSYGFMKVNKLLLPVFLVFLTFFSLSVFSQSQSKYYIKGRIDGLRDTVVFLANYYGNKLYYNDTSKVDAKGNFSFKGKPYNECGKYALVMPGPKYFDFIVAEENIYLQPSLDNDINKMVVKESVNNKIFFDYVKFINEKRILREPVDKCLNDSLKSDVEKKPCLDQLKKLNEEVVAYQKKIVKENPNLLVSKIIRMGMDVETPEAPDSLDGDEKLRWQYYWYRSHYWDNCDLNDPRLVREQQFHRLVETYLTKTLPQIPDTMCVQVKKLIDRAQNNEDAFKYIVHLATYTAETSKVMCMDRLFVFMVDNYYATGKATWMKSDKVEEMKKSADEKRYCLCGEIAQDVILPDTSEKKWISMKKTGGKYTLLVIWESTCGHCKKEVPKLLDLYHKWKDKGLVVYAVGNELENDKWKEFIKEHNLDWYNVSDTPEIMKQDSATQLIYGNVTTLRSLNYRTTWDVNSTPKVYLMDKDYKIIAKQLGSEQLDELLEKLEKGEELKMEDLKQHEYEDEDVSPGNHGAKGRAKPVQGKNGG